MDRLRIGVRSSSAGVLVFVLFIFATFAYKVIDEGWLVPRTPLELNGEPPLLFFNRHKGCECSMAVYRAAKDQVNNWSDEARQGIPVIAIDLDRRPDLGAQYSVSHAPRMLLLDETESVFYVQDYIETDAQPLNLQVFEEEIMKMLDKK